MATLEKIRNKAGLLVIVVGIALFAFIIGDFLNSGSTFFRQSQEKIAEINGEPITIQDYQERIDEMTEVYKMQSGSNNLPEEYAAQMRQSVFDGMVQDVILNEALAKLGMTVGAEELFDMVQGENISPIITQMPMFNNPETGVFDKTALLNFLKTISDDNIANYSAEQQAQLIQAKNFWLFWEKNIKRQRMEQKYTILLSKALAVNVLDAKESFNETEENADIVYAMQPYSSIPDSTINVGKQEIEQLYKQRKELYKQKEGKVIKYIAVDIRPSKEDYDKAAAEVESIREELATTDRIADVVNENSEILYMDAFFSENAMDPEMKQFVATASIGEIYGPAFENDKYRIFRLVDKTIAPDSVKVSHIMLANNGKEAALADSLMTVLKAGGDFAQLAQEFSVDQTAQNGGELGWFTEVAALRGLNEEFRDVIFSAPLNQVVQLKTTYGTHLVRVTERTANIPKYKIADIEITVTPSSKTYSTIYNELNQYITKNQDISKMDETAKEAGYNVVSNITVSASDQTVGNIKNSRQVVRWAFQNSGGKISDIFECDDQFVVAAVQGTLKEGYRSLASVEAALKSELIARKKGEQIVSDLKAKNLTSLQAYAEAMGSQVDSVKFINFATRRITGIGAEPKLNAMISLTPAGRLSEPVSGTNGVYVFEVIHKEKDAKEYNEAEQIKTLEASNAYRYGYQAIQSLTSHAKIVDNRIRFY